MGLHGMKQQDAVLFRQPFPASAAYGQFSVYNPEQFDLRMNMGFPIFQCLEKQFYSGNLQMLNDFHLIPVCHNIPYHICVSPVRAPLPRREKEREKRKPNGNPQPPFFLLDTTSNTTATSRTPPLTTYCQESPMPMMDMPMLITPSSSAPMTTPPTVPLPP